MRTGNLPRFGLQPNGQTFKYGVDTQRQQKKYRPHQRTVRGFYRESGVVNRSPGSLGGGVVGGGGGCKHDTRCDDLFECNPRGMRSRNSFQFTSSHSANTPVAVAYDIRTVGATSDKGDVFVVVFPVCADARPFVQTTSDP